MSWGQAVLVGCDRGCRCVGVGYLLVCPAFPCAAGPFGGWSGWYGWRWWVVADDVAPQVKPCVPAQGQWLGRCRMGRRCGRASRAGMLMILRPAWRRGPPRVGARRSAADARSRLWAIAAHNAQALLAPNRPDGRWARGPSIRSAKVVSMIAWWRWVISAASTRSRKRLRGPEHARSPVRRVQVSGTVLWETRVIWRKGRIA